jgi:hypothetical protein
MNPYETPQGAAPPPQPPPPELPPISAELGIGKLFGAIARGDGYARPRTVGAILTAIGIAIATVTTVMLVVAQRYPVYLTAALPMTLASGLFMLATGEPFDRGYPAPTWSRWGLGICFFGGILAGVALVVVLHA